jgi:hypothetical protein
MRNGQGSLYDLCVFSLFPLTIRSSHSFDCLNPQGEFQDCGEGAFRRVEKRMKERRKTALPVSCVSGFKKIIFPRLPQAVC